MVIFCEVGNFIYTPINLQKFDVSLYPGSSHYNFQPALSIGELVHYESSITAVFT
jgi:hypothetical protein